MRKLVFIATYFVTGCAIHGPKLTPVSHLAYNEAVQVSEQRELLLNLVRLRYNDAPQFLAISSISSQLRFGASASLGGVFGKDAGDATDLVAPSGTVDYSESPTVTFSPMRGEEFTKRLVTPVKLDSLMLLTRYGWSLERTLPMFVEELNGTVNWLPRDRASADDQLSAARFTGLSKLFASLNDLGLVEFGCKDQYASTGQIIDAEKVRASDLLAAHAQGFRFERQSETGPYELQVRARQCSLRITPSGLADTQVQLMLAQMRLKPGLGEYDLDTESAARGLPTDTLHIRTRSVLGVMAYVAHGIGVPRAVRGQDFPVASINGGYASPVPLAVRNSPTEPADSFIAVQYRGHWFYVENGDLESRRTLGVLASLMRLEITAGGATEIPVLTIPVAR